VENFNKNWLLILLVAVIFGTLGFLVGRTTSHRGQHNMMRHHGKHMDKVNIEVEVDEAEGDESTVKIDTIIKDGKQIIVKEVKKIK
jgi:autotransporter translocation and assembly factor TamB